MILLDTHAWIWWRDDPDRLSAVAAQAIAEADELGLSSISVWEVGTLVRRRRLSLDRDVTAWARQALTGIAVVPPDADVALTAAILDGAFPGDPVDRLIYATARAAGARLVTRDRRMAAYDAARVIW